MNDIFLIKLILSFIVGSVWITLLSVFAEKFGTKIGGAIAGIPATMVVALFFIGWTDSPEVASQATTLVPIVVGINTLVPIVYIILSHIGFYFSLISSLAVWFMLSFILVFSKIDNFFYSVIGYIFLLVFSYYILEKKLYIISIGKKEMKYTINQIVFRGVVSGLVIMLAVLVTKISGPLLGGVFASFPALTVAMIIIMHFSHDTDFSAAFLKNFIISGSINVVIFVAVIRYTYLYVDLFLGTVIAFLVSLLATYLSYNIINKRILS